MALILFFIFKLWGTWGIAEFLGWWRAIETGLCVIALLFGLLWLRVSCILFAANGSLYVFLDVFNIKNLILLLPSDSESATLRSFLRDPVQHSIILLWIFERISNNELFLIEFTLLVEGAPVLSQRAASVVLLETVFKLQQFFEQASCHLEPRLFSVHKLQGLDEAPPETLH